MVLLDILPQFGLENIFFDMMRLGIDLYLLTTLKGVALILIKIEAEYRASRTDRKRFLSTHPMCSLASTNRKELENVSYQKINRRCC